MKYEVKNYNTKKTISDTLKSMLMKKSFSKVTVSEIIRECKLNRKTFYYHFEDIYELLRWTLEQEVIDVVKKFEGLSSYKMAVIYILEYIEENYLYLINIYHSIGRDELKRFFYSDFVEIISSIIETFSKAHDINLDPNFQSFLSDFYTEALAGIFVTYITNHDFSNKKTIVSYVSIIFESSIPANIINYSTNQYNI